MGVPVFAPFRGCANHHFSGGYDLREMLKMGRKLFDAYEETAEAFIEYGSDHVPFAYYSFDDYIPQLMSKDMYNRIDSIKGFSFINHKDYPVSDERLNALNGFIQHRIHRILEFYN